MTGQEDQSKILSILTQTYAGGDFANAYFGGDTLFEFLMIELSEQEGCDSIVEAINRIEGAIAELSEVRDALRSNQETG